MAGRQPGPNQDFINNQIAQGLSAETVWDGFSPGEQSYLSSFEFFKSCYEDFQELAKPAATPHPFRLEGSSRVIDLRGEYDMTLQRQAYLNWIRKALYVSPRFRNDLEHVLWRDVKLNPYYSQESLPKLVDFLRGRPAIHQNLKKLEITFHTYFDTFNNSQNSKDCFQYLADNLKVEELILRIRAGGEDFGELELAVGEGELAHIKPIKDIKDTKHFVVLEHQELYGKTFYDEFDGDFDAYEARKKKWETELEERLLPKITELLRPHTLRIVEPSTEVEKCLAGRILPLAKAAAYGAEDTNGMQVKYESWGWDIVALVQGEWNILRMRF